MTLRLDQFGRSALEEQASAYGISLKDFVMTAAVYYLAELGSGRAGLSVPLLRSSQTSKTPPGSAAATSRLRMTLTLEPAAWDKLEAEAGRQRVSLARLIQHAAFYFLADLDAGRVAARVFERADNQTD